MNFKNNKNLTIYTCPFCGARFEMIMLKEPQIEHVCHEAACPFCCEFLKREEWLVA